LKPTPTFVVDCSVTITWCFEDERTAATDALLDRLSSEAAVVPQLWTVEVTNAMVIAERRGRVSVAQTTLFIDALLSLPIVVAISDAELMPQVVAVARAHNLSAYDSAYVVLALNSGLPLATLDKAIIAAGKQLGLQILS